MQQNGQGFWVVQKCIFLLPIEDALSLLSSGKKRFSGEVKGRDVLAGDVSLHVTDFPQMCRID